MVKRNFRPVFCMGGNTSAAGLAARKRMFAGGKTDMDTSGYDDDIDTGKAGRARMLTPDIMRALSPGMGTAINTPDSTLPNQPFNWSGVAKTAGRISDATLPYLSNIVNATRTPPMPEVPNQVSPVTLSKIRLDATRQKASNAARVQDLSADRSLDEQSAAAVRSSNLARNMDTQGQISEQEAFLNARQKAEAAGMNLNVDAMNTNAMNRYHDELTGRGIALQRSQSENLSNAVDKNIAIHNEAGKAKLDLQKLTTLSQIWKESGVYDRMMKRMKTDGNTDPAGVNAQSSWLADSLDEVNGTAPVKAMGGKMRYAFGGDPIVTNATTQRNANIGQTMERVNVRDLVAQSVQTGTSPMDLYNKNIGTGRSGNAAMFTNPDYHHIYDEASAFNARPDLVGKSPEERLTMFYNMPSANPVVDSFKREAMNTGHSVAPAPVVSAGMTYAKQAFGGFKNTVARGYLNPFGNTRSLGLGPGIEKDKFNPMHIRHTQHNLLAAGGAVKTDGASDVNLNWTNYGDATPDLYRDGGPFQEEWKHGGKLSSKVVDHSMWKQPYKENALTNNDPNPYQMAMGGEFSGEATARDMSMWNRKVWRDDSPQHTGVDILKSGGWIAKATDSIKRRGTEGVCTGSKFGSSSCPPGSRRYNLAKVFKHMAHNR